MKLFQGLSSLFWLAVLGFLALYVYGLVMGAFSPGELIGFTALAIAATVGLAIHQLRVRHAMEARDDPAHNDVARRMHSRRESRGF